jgi:signal transduction histidine kinase
MATLFHWEQENKPFIPDLTTKGLHKYTDLTLASGKNIAYIDLMVYVVEQPDSEVATIITIHNLTQSRELNFMKLDFVAIAAHELRTPLTVVRGYLDMLSTEAVKQMSIFNIESLQKAIVGTDQLRNLINKLLNIARIERGEMEIFVEKMNLTKMVEENVHQHQTPAAQRLQKLTCTIETDRPVYVPADPSSILEVLNNLIGNAIKYTPERGEIAVRLKVVDDQARVEVSDNGPGIPEDLRNRLFTKFYRAERSLIAGTRGTGLGLFISKTIIELQGGKIGLEPENGKGSTFYFTLPIYKAELHDKLIAKDKEMGGVRGWFKKRPHS